METKTLFIETDLARPDYFTAAKTAAERAVEERFGPAMLVAWKDFRTGEFSPNVIACKECSLDGWEMYAASRGAEYRVETGGGELAFLFKAV